MRLWYNIGAILNRYDIDDERRVERNLDSHFDGLNFGESGNILSF